MTAGLYNFTIEQGAEFTRVITCKDADGNVINLTGFSARMKIKRVDNNAVIKSLTVGSGLTLGGVTGTITINISHTDTTAMDFTEAKYDLELIDSNSKPDRLIEGRVTFSREVTD